MIKTSFHDYCINDPDYGIPSKRGVFGAAEKSGYTVRYVELRRSIVGITNTMLANSPSVFAEKMHRPEGVSGGGKKDVDDVFCA